MEFFKIFQEYSLIFLLCGGISSIISFADILEDYSIFRIKIGLKYKFGFAFFNGTVSLLILMLLWDSEILIGLSPIYKGLYVGLAYSVLLKSKVAFYGKNSPLSPEDLYKKVIGFFREQINDSTRTPQELILQKLNINLLIFILLMNSIK